jgi:hypothetical protein
MRGLGTALVFCITIALTSSAQAADPAPKDSPSAFNYAFRGLLAGSLVGLSAGYLGARRDGFESGDWKPVVYGVGFGALGGAAVGLTLGLVDLRERSRDTAEVALKDTVYAGALGTVAGAIVGGLVALNSDNAEHVGLGAAIGTLAGVGAGLTVGVIRGHVAAKRAADRKAPERKVEPTIATQADARGQRMWMLGATGRF